MMWVRVWTPCCPSPAWHTLPAAPTQTANRHRARKEQRRQQAATAAAPRDAAERGAARRSRLTGGRDRPGLQRRLRRLVVRRVERRGLGATTGVRLRRRRLLSRLQSVQGMAVQRMWMLMRRLRGGLRRCAAVRATSSARHKSGAAQEHCRYVITMQYGQYSKVQERSWRQTPVLATCQQGCKGGQVASWVVSLVAAPRKDTHRLHACWIDSVYGEALHILNKTSNMKVRTAFPSCSPTCCDCRSCSTGLGPQGAAQSTSWPHPQTAPHWACHHPAAAAAGVVRRQSPLRVHARACPRAASEARAHAGPLAGPLLRLRVRLRLQQQQAARGPVGSVVGRWGVRLLQQRRRRVWILVLLVVRRVLPCLGCWSVSRSC